MASNGNSPNKGQGANEPDHQQSLETDAANVDWMIISDISTRIGVAPKTKETNASTNSSPSQRSSTTDKNPQLNDVNDDLEDLEWLKSIGLDEPIERSPSSKITSNNQSQNNDIGNIDWLIVTDLKTRMDEPDIKAPVHTPPTAPELDLADELELGDSLNINELDFLGNTNFPELESLDFGDVDASSVDDFNVDDLLNEIDITEGKIRELSQLAEAQSGNDLFDVNNESLDNVSLDNDWDQIANIAEEFNELDFQQDLQTSEDESLDFVSDSFVRPTKLAKIGELQPDRPIDSVEEFIGRSTPESDSNDLENLQNQLISDEFSDEFIDAVVDELALEPVVGEITEEELLDSFINDNEALLDSQESSETFDSGQNEWIESDLISEISSEISEVVDEVDAFDQVQLSEPVDYLASDDFGQVQLAEARSPLAHDDAIWSNSPSVENDAIYTDTENAFASDWEVGSIHHSGSLDDAIWDAPASSESDDLSNTAIENVFVSPEEYTGNSEGDFQDWSAEIEAEINSNNVANAEWSSDYNESADYSADNAANAEWSSDYNESADYSADNAANAEWNSEYDDSEEYFPPSDVSSPAVGEYFPPSDAPVSSEAVVDFVDTYSEDNFDFSDSINEDSYSFHDNGLENLAIADESGEEAFNIDGVALEAIVESSEFSEALEDIGDIGNFPETRDEVIADFAEQNFAEHNEADNFQNPEEIYSSDLDHLDHNLDNALDSHSDWDDFNESIGEQFTSPDFSTGLASFDEQSYEPELAHEPEPELSSSDWSTKDTDNSLAGYDDLESIDSFIDENFDLDTFDEESFPEVPSSNLNNPNIATTLTPNRSHPPIEEAQNSLGAPMGNSGAFDDVDLAIEESLANDPFEEALAIDLLNGEQYSQRVDLIEEAIANDLLNGDISGIDMFQSRQELPTPPAPMPMPNLSPPANFGMETNDHDFLDDFDLDNLDTPLDGDNFDSGFIPPSISTGLNVPSAPVPPSVPPMVKQDNVTSPSLMNPPPPPFLPPLPPKRSPHQSKPPSHPPTSPNLASPPSMSRLGQDEFESFHGQSLGSKSDSAIDEGWTDLLDADTVLSGVLRPSTTPYADMGGSMPPSSGNSRGRSLGNAAGSSIPQARDSRHSSIPKRKDTGLPDLNDLGLEIHDDNTDWSGLLDTNDLSDNITSISNTSTQLPPRSRQTPIRSDITGVSETRELPRDRRPMPSFGDATQARMAAPPDQIDFNRFTEDNYGSYGGGYEPPVEKAPTPSPSRTKITIPSVSIESLWQDYLKFPVIGLGAIGGAFLLYSLVNRPVFDLGLRLGIFKDASGKDFTNYDFKGAKLDNVDFSKAILTGAKMQDASLVGVNFQEANLDGVNFTNANLSRARLIQTSVVWSEFKNAQMNLVDLAGADLTRSNFSGAKMEGANLKGTKIGAQGTEKATKFSPTTLLAWQIVNEPREGRNLANQDLSGLNLSFTSLRRANLTNVKLNYTDMTGTDLSGANLSGGQINGANLSGAKLNGINLSGVNFDKSKLPKTDEETVCPNGKKGPCKF